MTKEELEDEGWFEKYLDSKKELAEFEAEVRRDLKKIEDEGEEAERCKKELEDNMNIGDNQQKSHSDMSLGGNGESSEIERWVPPHDQNPKQKADAENKDQKADAENKNKDQKEDTEKEENKKEIQDVKEN